MSKTRLAKLTGLLTLYAVFIYALMTMLISALPAAATETSTGVNCPGVQGWYVNPDETDRKPETSVSGMKFAPADLIHHAADVAMVNVKPGSYVLATGSDTPDQPSFFSVEVRDASTGAYGTLRWDVAASQWTLVTNTASYSKAEPIGFVGVETKWGKLTPAARVISFGVGYTKSPAGTKTVTVKSVTFAGQTRSLVCLPPTKPVTTPPTSSPTVTPPATTPGATTPTTLPPTKPPVTTAPTTRPPATTPPPTTRPPVTTAPPTEGALVPVAGGSGGDGALPVTGAAAGIMAGVAMILVGIGGVLMVAGRRRRKVNFEG
jgi:hypothetical protein